MPDFARGDDDSAPIRYVTKDELDSCIAMLGSQVSEKVTEKVSASDDKISKVGVEMQAKISDLPTKGQYWAGLGFLVTTIMAGLALFMSLYNSGYDASEKKDVLQDKIEKNEATIQRILDLQEAAEIRAARDSENLQILVDGHTHRLEFKEKQPK